MSAKGCVASLPASSPRPSGADRKASFRPPASRYATHSTDSLDFKLVDFPLKSEGPKVRSQLANPWLELSVWHVTDDADLILFQDVTIAIECCGVCGSDVHSAYFA